MRLRLTITIGGTHFPPALTHLCCIDSHFPTCMGTDLGVFAFLNSQALYQVSERYLFWIVILNIRVNTTLHTIEIYTSSNIIHCSLLC